MLLLLLVTLAARPLALRDRDVKEAFQTEDKDICARADAMRERWRVEVVDKFAARYKLWGQ